MVSFPLDLRTDLQIGGVWIPANDVRTSQDVTITRGRSNPNSQPDPVRGSLKLNNRHGDYSPDNPLGPYYGQIDQNVPIRVSLPGEFSYLELGDSRTGSVSTPHATALNITGDIDVRFEADIDRISNVWPNQTVIGKWGTTDPTRSWMLRFLDGDLLFNWVDSGGVFRFVSMPLRVIPGNAIRFTMDVNNGAGGMDAAIYSADTMDGPWGPIFSATFAGVQSIQSTTSPLTIGVTDATTSVPRLPFVGTMTRAEVRSGINGTVVAAPDFRGLAAGTASFADSAGRTWTVNSPALVSDRDYRITAEASSLPTGWDASGRDVFVTVQASGIRQRLGRGQKELPSSLARRVPSYAPLAYWPLEEGQDATQGYSPVPGVAPLSLSNVDWASADSLPSSAPLPAFRGTGSSPVPVLRATVPPPTSATTGWQVSFAYRLDTGPSTLRTMMRILTTGGTIAEWQILQREGFAQVVGKNSDGGTVFTEDIIVPELYGRWNLVSFDARQNGGNIAWAIGWKDVSGDKVGFNNSVAGTVGTVRALASPASGYSADLAGMAIGHIAVFGVANTQAYLGAIDAWENEPSGVRMLRLASESGIPLAVRGSGLMLEHTRLGYQRIGTFLQLLTEAAEADGGVLSEPRNRLGFTYRSRVSMYNQTPVAVSFGQLRAGSGQPVRDDSLLRNDMTVTRAGGSSGRYEETVGPRSVDAVGRYDSSTTLSLYQDAQAAQMAAWLVHLGTTTGPRYPNIVIDVHAFPELAESLAALDIGDRLQITDIPVGKGPVGGVADLIVQGITETLSPVKWTFTLACTPASPWNVGIVGDVVFGKADTDGSELAVGVTGTATTLAVTTTSGPRWTTDPAEYPFDLILGGETVTATACTPSLLDTFGRTVASGWGTPDVGSAWTTSGGSASDYAVGSGVGTHTMTSTNVSRRCLTPQIVADFDLQADIATSVTATGQSITAGLIARSVDGNNLYQARLEFTTSQGIVLTIRKRVASTETVLATFTVPLVHTAGVFYRLRFQGAGTTLNAKVWDPAGAEPAAWQATATDASLTAAADMGTRSILITGNTNTSPVVRYDNVTSLAPQLVTVARSTNDVVKPHAAGTAIRLLHPAIVAL
ncbi:hypothetical protein PV392_08100 [Streptomyces sp. ME03-5709C]|nr:hypothetical protein [Streptomyces sp. ME03-5709C]